MREKCEDIETLEKKYEKVIEAVGLYDTTGRLADNNNGKFIIDNDMRVTTRRNYIYLMET